MSVKHFSLTVQEVIHETKDAVTIKFQDPKNELINFVSGQFLTILTNQKGENLRRAYSISASPLAGEPLSISVKKVPGGKVSPFMVEQLQAGTTLEVLEPIGHFTFQPDLLQKRHVVLIGGGSGITPLFSILKSVLLGEPETKVTLIYCNRDEESVIYKQEIEQLHQQNLHRFKLVHVYSQPKNAHSGPVGRLDGEMLEEILHHTSPVIPGKTTLYYLCGPIGLMQTVQQKLESMGIAKNVIFHENFLSTIDEAAKAQFIEEKHITDKKVTIKLDKKEYQIVVPASKSILEAALDNKIDMPYSCQSGLCTACRGKCLSGKVAMEDADSLSDGELQEGYVLTCVGHPETDNVVIEMG